MSEVKRSNDGVRLLSCPFCGGEATAFPKKFIDGLKFGVMCKEPFCCIIPANFNTKEEAIKAWNTRKPMDDIVERLESIEDSIYEARMDIGNKIYSDAEEHQRARNLLLQELAYNQAKRIVKEVGGSCD